MQDPFCSSPTEKGRVCFECFTKSYDLGKVETLSDVGQTSSKLHKLGKISHTANKEWKSFKVGLNRKLRARLEPAAREQRSRWHIAPHTPVYLLCSSSLCSWYHNSLQPA